MNLVSKFGRGPVNRTEVITKSLFWLFAVTDRAMPWYRWASPFSDWTGSYVLRTLDVHLWKETWNNSNCVVIFIKTFPESVIHWVKFLTPINYVPLAFYVHNKDCMLWLSLNAHFILFYENRNTSMRCTKHYDQYYCHSLLSHCVHTSLPGHELILETIYRNQLLNTMQQ